MKPLKKYFQIPKAEKKLFRKAFCHLFLAWFNTSFSPMKKYVKKLGKEKTESPETALQEHQEYLLSLKTAIRRAAKFAPFKSRCLQQAYAGKIILNKQNIPSTIYFGVAKDETKGLKAHAWLRAGDIYISGGKERFEYAVVGNYS